MDANTSSTPIFRTVDVAKGVPITLGQPLSAEAMALMEQVGPDLFQLKQGTFGDAQQIDVHLGVGGAVQKMDFTYGHANYQEMLANFEGELGPPTSQTGSGDDEVTVWRDDSTEFTLRNSPSGVTSTLRDLAPTSTQATA